MSEANYWTRKLSGRVSRRSFLRGVAAGGAGIAGAALIGCAGEDDTPGATSTATSLPTATPSGTSSDPFANIKRGGIFKNTTVSDPPTIHPYGSAAFAVKGTATYAYSRLYRIAARPDSNPYNVGAEPEIAESAETDDGQTWIVKLREGVKFHNKRPVSGRELTTEDVLASWQALSAETSPSRSQVATWERVEAVDDYTLRIRLTEPSGTFLTDLADASKLLVMPREAFDGGFDPAVEMIGTGPWILDRYEVGTGFEFSRNPDYWEQPKPFVDGIKLSIIPEAANRLAQFSAGNTHVEGISSDDLLEIRKSNDKIQWRGLLTALLSFIYFSPEEMDPDAAWRDPRFRQGVSMLQDRDALTEFGFNVRALQEAGLDVSVAWNNVIPAGWAAWWLDPKSPEMGDAGRFFTYDPAEATRLITASGYAGEEIPFIYANDAYGATFGRIAEALHGQLVEGGLNLKLTAQPYSPTYINQTFLGDFHGMAFGYESTFPEVGSYVRRMFGDDPANHGKISDAEITELDEKQRAELDPNVRKGYIHEVQRLNARNMYYVPSQAGAGTTWTGYQPEVRGITLTRGYGSASEILPNHWLDV